MTFNTRMEPKTAQIPAKSKKTAGLSTYDPSRVKSSIPGAKSAAIAPHKARKNQQSAASYVEELKKAEVKRAVKMEQEQEAT